MHSSRVVLLILLLLLLLSTVSLTVLVLCSPETTDPTPLTRAQKYPYTCRSLQHPQAPGVPNEFSPIMPSSSTWPSMGAIPRKIYRYGRPSPCIPSQNGLQLLYEGYQPSQSPCMKPSYDPEMQRVQSHNMNFRGTGLRLPFPRHSGGTFLQTQTNLDREARFTHDDPFWKVVHGPCQPVPTFSLPCQSAWKNSWYLRNYAATF